ncbi:MAG: hypothetical protein WAL25_12670 [Acidimicrobiia bacterium]
MKEHPKLRSLLDEIPTATLIAVSAAAVLAGLLVLFLVIGAGTVFVAGVFLLCGVVVTGIFLERPGSVDADELGEPTAPATEVLPPAPTTAPVGSLEHNTSA